MGGKETGSSEPFSAAEEFIEGFNRRVVGITPGQAIEGVLKDIFNFFGGKDNKPNSPANNLDKQCPNQ